MSAIQALELAHAAGVRVAVKGDALSLSADAPPPEPVLALLAQYKTQIIGLLHPDGGDWSREDWRDYFEERAGIREYDGAAPRADAEAGALADCVARWRALNPLPASDDRACVQCGKSGPDTPVLAPGGHAWLHRGCWEPMNTQRNRVALEAVKATLHYKS